MTMREKGIWGWFTDTSLRWKIHSGHFIIGALFLLLLLLFYDTLQSVQEQVNEQAHIARLLNTILEARRYEKNFLLYRKQDDLLENHRWREQAMQMVDRPQLPLLPAYLAEQWWLLQQQLDHYNQAMEQYSLCWNETCGAVAGLEDRIRHHGKEVVSSAEGIDRAGHDWLQRELQRHRLFLLWFAVVLLLLVMGVGGLLSRAVTRPLQWMEEAMQKVASGKMHSMEPPSNDREFRSLTAAFNRMLMEIDIQQRGRVRSEKLASLGTMLAGVAHELNNPLSNIATSCQILLEESQSGSFHDELLQQIDSQTMRARDIVRVLLDLTRKHPFHRQKLDIEVLVQETLLLLSVPAGIRLHQNRVPGLTVVADRGRLQQVLLNLLQNALDVLNGTGDITIRTGVPAAWPDQPDLWLAGRADPAHLRQHGVEIAVADNGPGMTEELLQQVFDPFFTTKKVGCGVGLGLFITWEIVDEHGGVIWVESRPGQGSCFHLLFPGA
ncbi:MAG: HAMP domain-containing protein [Magnetococcales bacterium]|nr:HAMP domain-containing protein [Magnetococcales bacterium]